jgi:excisionase family DNA binding protein
MATAAQPNEAAQFEHLFSAKEAASYLRMHVKTLQRMAREGRVPCARIGKHWRFRLSDLDHWVREQQNRISRPFRVERSDDLEIRA